MDSNQFWSESAQNCSELVRIWSDQIRTSQNQSEPVRIRSDLVGDSKVLDIPSSCQLQYSYGFAGKCEVLSLSLEILSFANANSEANSTPQTWSLILKWE